MLLAAVLHSIPSHITRPARVMWQSPHCSMHVQTDSMRAHMCIVGKLLESSSGRTDRLRQSAGPPASTCCAEACCTPPFLAARRLITPGAWL